MLQHRPKQPTCTLLTFYFMLGILRFSIGSVVHHIFVESYQVQRNAICTLHKQYERTPKGGIRQIHERNTEMSRILKGNTLIRLMGLGSFGTARASNV